MRLHKPSKHYSQLCEPQCPQWLKARRRRVFCVCVSAMATRRLYYMVMIKKTTKKKHCRATNNLVRLINQKGIHVQNGLLFACQDQVEPSSVCVCLAAFRKEIPAPLGRRTLRCPARRTSPPSTSGRSKSWKWRWRKVSVCVY